MGEFLYDLFNSNTFWFILILWVLVCIAWKAKREKLISRLGTILSKPVIFEEDPDPDTLPFYPRRFLEKVASAFTKGLVAPLVGLIAGLGKVIQGLWQRVYNPERPWRVVGYVFFLLMLLVFVYADAIAIVNGIDILGLLETGVPDFLTEYSIAVTMGSLFSVITGGLVYKEINSTKSIYTDWDEVEGSWKEVARTLALILIIGGFVVVVTLGLIRWDALNTQANGPDFTSIGNTIIAILVPVNTVLATFLIYEEGLIKGGSLVLIALLMIVLGALHGLNFVLSILAYVLPFLLDMVMRTLHFILDIVLYFAITPIDFVFSPLNRSRKPDPSTTDTLRAGGLTGSRAKKKDQS